MDAYQIAAELYRPLVLRITFKSGGVSEERGNQEDIDALFEYDHNKLIDHVYGYDTLTHEVLLAHHEDDLRWEDFTPDMPF